MGWIFSAARGAATLAATTALVVGTLGGASAAQGSTTLAPPVQPRAVSAEANSLSRVIELPENSGPSSMVFSPDGTTGYILATDGTLSTLDLTTYTVTSTVSLGWKYGDELVINAAGTLAYATVGTGAFADTVLVIDLATGTVVSTQPSKQMYIGSLILTADETSYFVAGPTDALKINAATGVVEYQASPGSNLHAMVLSADGNTLFVKNNIYNTGFTVYNAADLSVVSHTLTTRDVSELALSSNPDVLYGRTGGKILTIDAATGAELAEQGVGNSMYGLVVSPAGNRVYAVESAWGLVMAANLSTGVRSESTRDGGVGPADLFQNPVTGDLFNLTRGWTGERDHIVTAYFAPGVTDPVDQHVTTDEDEVTFETTATGITASRGGGLVWESSADGVTWTPIDGETGSTLTVAVTPASAALSYRVAYSDDFWGLSGASAAATIDVDGPSIIRANDLPDATVGEEYAPQVFTAEGRSDLAWSVATAARSTATLPEGLELDAATGTLSGTPTAAGSYVLTVTVTDSFGSDTRDFSLVVGDSATVTPPPTEAPEEPTVEPTVPGVTPEGSPSEGDASEGNATEGNATGAANGTDGLAVTGTDAFQPLVWAAIALLGGAVLMGGRALRRR